MLPANKRPGSPTGGGNFYMFKKATPEERKAALTFIKWMTAPEVTAEWSIATGYVAISPAAYETAAMKKYAARTSRRPWSRATSSSTRSPSSR